MAKLMKQLFACISYLYSRGIAHKDLKPENIMFHDFEDVYSLKIINFGNACKIKRPLT